MKRFFLMIAVFLSACGASPAGTAIRAADFKGEWPLKADKATLGCDPPRAAWIVVDGVRYALNGKALEAGLPRGDAIARSGNAVALSVFLPEALALCG